MSATTNPGFRHHEQQEAAPLHAEAWQRVVARLVDHVGLAFVTAMLFLPLGLGAAVLGGAAGLLAGAASAVLSAALTVGYFTLLESRGGQTLGKRLLGLRVVDATGRAPAPAAALRRNAWTGLGILGVVPFVGGLLGGVATLVAAVTILLGLAGDTRRGWHDTFAGTRVVSDR